MLKCIALLSIVIVLLVSAGFIYLALLSAPAEIRNILVKEAEDATGKNIFFGQARFDIFKGLAIDGFYVYDEDAVIIRAKEVSLTPLFLPILKNRVIIPSVRVDAPDLFIKRSPDGSLNIAKIIYSEYFLKKTNISINRIILKNGLIRFVDRVLEEPFEKSLSKLNCDIALALPDKVTFRLDAEMADDAPHARLKLSGEYRITDKAFSVRAEFERLSPKEFVPYYRDLGISFPDGTADSKIDIHVKGDSADGRLEIITRGLMIERENLKFKIDSRIRSALHYDFPSHAIEYSGEMEVDNLGIDGIEKIGRLDGIKASVAFDDARLHSENVSVNAFGIPWTVRVNLVNYKEPVLDIYAKADTYLSSIEKTLVEAFGIKFPADLSGKSIVDFAMQFENSKPARINGSIETAGATVSLEPGRIILEDMKAVIRFTPERLEWEDAIFKHNNVSYRSSGRLTGFGSPAVVLNVSSKDLSFKSSFIMDGSLIKLSSLDGRYLGSEFSVVGDVDLADPGIIDADIKILAKVDAEDLKSISGSSAWRDNANPKGIVDVEIELSGDLKKIGSCGVDAKARSGRLSLFGFRMNDTTLDYTQEQGVGRVKGMRSSLYGGSMRADCEIDLVSAGFPYSLTISAGDVKLERMKDDIGMGDSDISGEMKIYASIKGRGADKEVSGGLGKISISKGRLWQINLFKGLGALIFTSDFSDIVFTEGSCNFRIEDRAFRTGDFTMKSGLLNLYGSGEIGFDKSVKASLKAELQDEAISSGFRKNIASAVEKYTFINVSGTLKDPGYKIVPSASDIVEDIKDRLFRQ